MADINRVVKGSPEQLTEILTEGSITVDDITVTREEIESGSTLFDTGRLDQMRLNQQIQADMHRLYGYNHTSFTVKDINAVYNDIITAKPELADKSAIGFTALLHNGATVSMQKDTLTNQGNIMYIYGKTPTSGYVQIEEQFNDYTFTDDENPNSTEFVIVWYFSNNEKLNYTPHNFNIFNLAVVKSSTDTSTFNFATGYSDYVSELISYGGFNFPTSTYVKTLIANSINDGPLNLDSFGISNNDLFVVINAKSIQHYINKPFNLSSKKLKNIDFSKVEIIDCNWSSSTGSGFFSNGGSDLVIDLSNLRIFKNNNSTSTKLALFDNMTNITIPAKLEKVTHIICNKAASNAMILLCKNLKSMPSGWCGGTVKPIILEIADDWGCSIDLSLCVPTATGSKWTETSTWIDFLAEGLRDFSLEKNQNGYYLTLDTSINSNKTYYIKNSEGEFVAVSSPNVAYIDEYYEPDSADSNGFYRLLTIPSTILTDLMSTTEGQAALAEAERKLWDISGA